jgi:hypothetical protein
MSENEVNDVEKLKRKFADLKEQVEDDARKARERREERREKVTKLRLSSELTHLLEERIAEFLQKNPGNYRDSVNAAKKFAFEWKKGKMQQAKVSKRERESFLLGLNEQGQVWHDKSTLLLDHSWTKLPETMPSSS